MNRDGRNIKITNDAAGWNYDINISPQTTGADVINSMLQDRVIDHCDYRLVYYSKKYTVLIETDKPLFEQLSEQCASVHLIPASRETPLAAMFLGPKAENGDLLLHSINNVLCDYFYWRKNSFPKDSSAITTRAKDKSCEFFDDFEAELQVMLNELKESFPFHSPRYMGHMLSEQTLPSIVGYFAGMLYNPNNVTDEAAPITVAKEIEYGKMICQMLGYTSNAWAHICSGGTLANLEALWTARLVQFLPLCIQELCEL